MTRHCPICGGKMTTETSPGGIPRRVFENGPHGVTDERAISFFVGSDADDGLGIDGGGGGPSGSQQITLGAAGLGRYALWRRSGGPGVVALGRRAAPTVKRVGASALSGVGALVRGTGRALRRLVGAFT